MNNLINIDKVIAQHSTENIVEDFVEIFSNEKIIINRRKIYKVVNSDSIDKNKSGSHFLIKGSHIKVCKSEDGKNCISLNRKQRTLLNIEQYKIDDRNTARENVYNIRIEDSMNIKNNIIKNLCSDILIFFVGKKNTVLCVKRPYTIDENFNLVRLSANNMKILGLKDMDRVNITYGNNTISANALTISDITGFKQCNYDTLDAYKSFDDDDCAIKKYELLDENYCVLMPIHLRQKLFGTSYDENRANVIYNTCVKVGRDNKYIFEKGLYKQLIPLILAIFSLFKILPIFIPVFNDALLLAIISIFGSLFTLYLNLAEERNICK